MPFSVKIEQFQGPLDLLLELIEKQELDITKVSLAEITEEYLAHLENVELQPEELADFLVVASKLLYIKSQALFPQIALEDEGASLEEQLKLLKMYHNASKKIEEMINQKNFVYFRDKMPVTRIFRPPQKTTAVVLKETMDFIIQSLSRIAKVPKEIKIKAVSIGERIQHIKDQILAKARFSFHSLWKSSQDKTDIIVNFLALLELCKQKVIQVEQKSLFNEIWVEKKAE